MAQISTFGITAKGDPVAKITLRAHGLQVGLLTYGAILQSLRLDGVPYDLTLGSDRLTDYEAEMRFHGSLIAPVANRIRGARAEIAGKTCTFESNQDGQHCLHSGSTASYAQLWQLLETTDTSATLAIDLPDGQGGFPGNRHLRAHFSIPAPATLRLDLTATTDAPTVFNATNHSYWNLDGTPNYAGHRLHIAADHWLQTDAENLPTGKIIAAAGSALDFRTARPIAPLSPPLDNCFCLSNAPRAMTHALTLTGTRGVTLRLATTEPGVQVYDARGAQRPGGAPYEGIAIETQGWPDATNHPAFPPITLLPGTPKNQSTEWHFVQA